MIDLIENWTMWQVQSEWTFSWICTNNKKMQSLKSKLMASTIIRRWKGSKNKSNQVCHEAFVEKFHFRNFVKNFFVRKFRKWKKKNFLPEKTWNPTVKQVLFPFAA